MKLLLTFIMFVFWFNNIMAAKPDKLNATYVYDMSEFLVIQGDSFCYYSYPPFASLFGLDNGDSILAEGEVKYESDEFIKLISKNYEREVRNNMTVSESHIGYLEDSVRGKNTLRFRFNFPFEGKYKIILYLYSKYYNGQIKRDYYDFDNIKNNQIILQPYQYIDSITQFCFTVVNQTPIDYWTHNYLKTIEFTSDKYEVKDKNSNHFEISIPDLSNSYFNRYLINGEYIRVGKEKDVLFYHNEQFWKIGRD
ncbi:hypothetical protein FACS1894178_8010 [Bacteroidia bacterium]|nr:hypothetical protein FACS1894178_8010 [Bacteroidia bacterium]